MRNRINKIFPAILAVMFLGFTAFGQTALPTPPPPDDDVVKISTALIQIDVSVTDKKGNSVKNLKPEEIEIYENGKRQTITNFNFISGENQTAVNKPEAGKPNIPVPPSQLRAAQVKRTFALIVDDLGLSFESIYNVRQALRKFVDKQMQEGDLVAIIRTGAGIGALQQFTADKRQLYAAIEKVTWNPRGRGGISAFAPLESKIFENNSAVESGDVGDDSDENEPDTFASDAESFRDSIFTVGTLGAVNFVVRGMQTLPGRKSIMLFSDGFPLFTEENGAEGGGRILSAMQSLIDLANRASVVIYTIDSRGLPTTGITAADDTSGRTIQEIAQVSSDRSNLLSDTRDGLIYLAEQTGGISIYNNNDLNYGVRKMLDDQSYYLVGYEPNEEVFDPAKRQFNKLEVKVKRAGVNVRYRSGFFGISDEQIAAKPAAEITDKDKILGALTSPFAVNDIALRLNAVFGSEEKIGSYIRSFVHIEGKNISFKELPNGKKEAVFDIAAMEFGDNGVPVDQIYRTFKATVDEKKMLDIQKRGIVYNFVFPAKTPGAYQLRIAINDKTSGKVGSANQFIEVPNLKKKRLALSGIILENIPYETWQQLNAGLNVNRNSAPLDDTSLRQFKAGTVLNYGVVIFNPKIGASGKPELVGKFRIYRDGKVLFDSESKPVEIPSEPNYQKINFGGSLNLGTSMKPGDYILQVIVTDNLAKKKRQIATQFVPFEIVE